MRPLLCNPILRLLATVLIACTSRFEPSGSTGIDATGSGADTLDSNTSSNTTTGVSATSAGDSLPPPPPTSGGDASGESGSTTGADCVDGELQCAEGIEPFLLVCEGGSWKRVPQSHASDAGDCDGVCDPQTGGEFLASACVDGACVCDRSCSDTGPEATWENGYCADGFTFRSCTAGQWTPVNCADLCASTWCGGATGSCESGAYHSDSKSYYDTCLCDVTGCGSCAESCGLKDTIPDGNGFCSCDVGCVDADDCCYDYFEVCGGKDVGSGREVDVDAGAQPGPDGLRLTSDVAARTWPSLRAYPQVPDALLAGLARKDPATILAGLRDAFDTPSWPTTQRWDRFGAIQISGEPEFVTLEQPDRASLGRVSLGCLGGFAEAVRVLDVPLLRLETLLAPAATCPEAAAGATSCPDEAHAGLHALLNLRDEHLVGNSVRLFDVGGLDDLQRTFRVAPAPYYVSASHVGRKDSVRRYHHMMVVLVDADAAVSGPMIFDTTGRRGVAFRRVSWHRLSRYFGLVLAEGTRVPYRYGSARIAVLQGGSSSGG